MGTADDMGDIRHIFEQCAVEAFRLTADKQQLWLKVIDFGGEKMCRNYYALKLSDIEGSSARIENVELPLRGVGLDIARVECDYVDADYRRERLIMHARRRDAVGLRLDIVQTSGPEVETCSTLEVIQGDAATAGPFVDKQVRRWDVDAGEPVCIQCHEFVNYCATCAYYIQKLECDLQDLTTE